MPARSNSGCRRTLPTLASGRQGRERSGFTLIELVVVLVLMGITMAVVIPTLWQAASSDTANTLAAPVVSVLRYAQRTAAQQNDVMTVSINPETNAYQARAQRTGLIIASGKFAFLTPSHFLADSSRLTVSFNPTGSVDADSLVLSDANGVVDVRVDPWSGTINVVHR